MLLIGIQRVKLALSSTAVPHENDFCKLSQRKYLGYLELFIHAANTLNNYIYQALFLLNAFKELSVVGGRDKH